LAVRSAPDERQRRKAVKPGIRLVSMVISALKGQLHCPIDQSLPEANAIRKFFVHQRGSVKQNFSCVLNGSPKELRILWNLPATTW
jgi:hypothetical protein